MTDNMKPPASDPIAGGEKAVSAGGRYRLQRWDGYSLEWRNGISQPWDSLDLAMQEAQQLAKQLDARIGIFDRLMNRVCDVFPSYANDTPQPDIAPVSAGEFVNPTAAYEATLTRDELLARLNDQARIIHELYTGKHGVVPHPSEVWKPGLWEVYKPDDHQGSAEWVGEVGELTRLRADLNAARTALEGLHTQFDKDYLHMTKCAEGAKKLFEREERHGANANREILGERNAEISLYENFAGYIDDYRKALEQKGGGK